MYVAPAPTPTSLQSCGDARATIPTSPQSYGNARATTDPASRSRRDAPQ